MAERSNLGPLDKLAAAAVDLLRQHYPHVTPRAVRLEVKPYDRVESCATAAEGPLVGQPLIVTLPSWEWTRMPQAEALHTIVLPAMQDAIQARLQPSPHRPAHGARIASA